LLRDDATIDKNGNHVNDTHIRMKGIPGDLLSKNTLEIYQDLYEGKTINFDLMSSVKANFKFNSDQSYSRYTSFTRSVKF
jgi:hypothetical protein